MANTSLCIQFVSVIVWDSNHTEESLWMMRYRTVLANKTLVSNLFARQEKAKPAYQHMFEARGPGGCWLLIEVLTDNTSRSQQEIKRLLNKNGSGVWSYFLCDCVVENTPQIFHVLSSRLSWDHSASDHWDSSDSATSCQLNKNKRTNIGVVLQNRHSTSGVMVEVVVVSSSWSAKRTSHQRPLN